MKNCAKNQLFMISPHFRWDFFFRNSNFSKNFIYTPQFFFHPRVHKMINYKYTKFGIPTLTTQRMTSDQTRLVLIPPPPGLIRVNSPTTMTQTSSTFLTTPMTFMGCFTVWSRQLWPYTFWPEHFGPIAAGHTLAPCHFCPQTHFGPFTFWSLLS